MNYTVKFRVKLATDRHSAWITGYSGPDKEKAMSEVNGLITCERELVTETSFGKPLVQAWMPGVSSES